MEGVAILVEHVFFMLTIISLHIDSGICMCNFKVCEWKDGDRWM